MLRYQLSVGFAAALIWLGACGARSTRNEGLSLRGLDPPGSESAALSFLDARTAAWTSERACAFSCHTGFPHLLAVGASGAALSPAVVSLRSALVDRSANWAHVRPWYSSYPSASRGTESVLNAAALVALARGQSLTTLGADTRRALSVMWSEQQPDGSWAWLDVFGLLPWEGQGAAFWGTLQAANAIGSAPGNYLAECAADAACAVRLGSLRRYIITGFSNKNPLSLHNRAWVLIVSRQLPDLLSALERDATTRAIINAQGISGAWRQESLGLGRGGTADSSYATAIMVSALRGAPSASSAVARGMAWLKRNQADTGAWQETSINDPSDPFKNALFTDAATAYALVAGAAEF